LNTSGEASRTRSHKTAKEPRGSKPSEPTMSEVMDFLKSHEETPSTQNNKIDEMNIWVNKIYCGNEEFDGDEDENNNDTAEV